VGKETIDFSCPLFLYLLILRQHDLHYEKYFAWITSAHSESAIAYLCKEYDLLEIPTAESRQCEALQLSKPVIHIPPSVWSGNCYRQGSWFRSSPLFEHHLFVANRPFNWGNGNYAIQPVVSGTIQVVDIQNPPEPTPEEYLPLLNMPEFLMRVPQEWWHLLDREKPIFTRFFPSKGITLNFDDILKIHSANHAQFIVPIEKALRTVQFREKVVPVSLFRSDLICSACMELFGVLGSHHSQMLLKNCPGLKYVRLDQNQYFLVTLNPYGES
jgi:hypothetical protein